MFVQKKLLLSVVILVIVGLLGACDYEKSDKNSVSLQGIEVAEGEGRFSEKVYEFVGLSKLGITTDKLTGCKYIIYETSGANPGSITPLLGSDGLPDCGE